MQKVNTPNGRKSGLLGIVVAGRNCLAWYGSVSPATRQYKGDSSKAVSVNEGLRVYVPMPAGITRA